ncbi:N-acetylgalactosaminide beta-1,3-galactosyltransferase [Aphelenchoides besseyi]|nr:N-acetylgalactosaminide beta-1,3-galactosyltransferase [Aphelenchoides besseyi]KAI6237415.1 N-acetylgalactosaminide beta-1,3-galactosyltransferase [Aphelenchoides besseyi]
MRRQQPILWVLLGAAIGGFTVFRFSNPTSTSLFSLNGSRSAIRADRHHNSLLPEIHEHEHEDSDGQEQLFQFQHEHEESDVVKELKQNVRVLCWIMTGPNNTNKAKAVNATWAPRCNKYFFVTAGKDSGLPTIDFNITDGRNHLWAKTKAAFKYLYENDLNDYDWFLKADDDTFVIMENLRFMLLSYSPSDPVYFGCKFKPIVKQGYMSGGSGYVLSREALRRFVEKALNNTQKCKASQSGAEDVEMGKCLQAVDVVAGDSRDAQGKHRMLPFPITSHFDVTGTNKSVFPAWFHQYIYYPYNVNQEPLSDYVISFHYTNKALMYALYNQIYHIKAFGVSDDSDRLAKAKTEGGLQLIDTLTSLSRNNSRPFADMVAERDKDLAPKEG